MTTAQSPGLWATLDPHVKPVNFASEPDGRITVHVSLVEDGLIRSMEIREHMH